MNVGVSQPFCRSPRSKLVRRLNVESLEERVVFNAVNPASPVVPPEIAGGDESIVGGELAGHNPGCSCPACVKIVTGSGSDERVAWALPPIFGSSDNGPRDPDPAPPYPGQTFTLHSRPSSPRKIFLDFDGHTTSGTSWNSAFNGNQPFTVGAFNFEGAGSSFTTNEEERIQRIWQRVMEDFSPFDVDVTTEDPGVAGLTYTGGSDMTWGIRVMITPDDGWISDDVGGVGGIAYVPSFKSGVDITCYVFSSNLGPNDEKFIAEAASHEVGHTLGLGHDGTSSQGYYGGHNGSGTPGWAPIMGVGYSQPLVQWSKGEYPGANNQQDDLSIITNTSENFGYRPDDAGNTIASATPANVTGTSLTFSGVIERTSDVDVLAFSTGTGDISFNFTPWVNSPNLDIRAELRDSSGILIGATVDPLDTLNASMTRTITSAGTYYLFIEGVGVGNASSTGYSDYASLGQYTVTGTIISIERLHSLEGTNLNFIENQSPVALSSSIVVSPGSNINQATIAIGNYANGQDSLFFTNQGGITGNFNTGTGLLTLSGVASPGVYQAALRSVTYANSSNAPSAATRTLTFQLRDAANNLTNSLMRTLTVTPVNDQPTLDALTDWAMDEDSSGQTVSLSGISDGAGEGQTLTITAVSNNPAVVPNPSVTYSSPSGGGSISVVPGVNMAGTATITVTVSDGGGTANGGVPTISRSFVVTVNPINDAPSFNTGPDPYSPLIGGAQTLSNWASAIDAGGQDETPQTLTFNLSNDDNSLFIVQPFMTSDGTLNFTPVPNAIGIANVSVYLQDDGGTANGGFDTSPTQNFAINVGINRAPIIDDSGSPLLAPVAQSSVDPESNLIASFAASAIADLDPGSPLGIAVTSVDSTKGTWQFSLDDGTTWQSIDGASFASARLLRVDDQVRYLPTSGQIGKATMTYRAWDQSSGTPGGTADLNQGTGGSSAFSVDEEIATVRVAAAVTTILEDGKSAGKPLTVLPASTFADSDLKPKRGVAIVGAGGHVNGIWQYNANRKGWKSFANFDPSSALLLRSEDKVRFLPAANAFGEAYLVYRAWDQSTGTAGSIVDLSGASSVGGSTAFSSGTDFMFAVVKEVNDRPTLDKAGAFELTPVSASDGDPAGDSVARLLKSLATDQDAGTTPALAVTGFSKTGGTWQYQLAGGSSWTDIPSVSARSSWLLGHDDRIRFRPDGIFQGIATLSIKGWDQTAGVSGAFAATNSAAFSRKSVKAQVVVSGSPSSSSNTAPTLNITPDMTLLTIDEDSKPLGDLVSNLILAGMSDPDSGSLRGIAVTGLTGTPNGVWQYSANGRKWKPVGNVSDEVALLLADTDRIRFLPHANFHGVATVNYHAWDRTVGTAGQYANLTLPGMTGGDSAFSTADETATLTVSPVNDSPVLNLRPKPVLNSIPASEGNPAGTTVATLLGTAYSDVDGGSQQGIAVSKLPLVLGEWQYRLQGQSSWTTFSVVSPYEVMLLRPTDQIRLLASADFVGKAAMQYRAWDQTSGAAGDFALADENLSLGKQQETATILVGMPNFRPILDTKPTVNLPPIPLNISDPSGYLVSSLLGASVVDADSGGRFGIAITGLDSKNGIWQYAIDGGEWFTLGDYSGVSLLLKSTDMIRFIPNVGYAGSASIKYKAWDQTEGVAGNFMKATTSAFSKAVETATVAVNTAPSLNW